jgi:hypothetical protein
VTGIGYLPGGHFPVVFVGILTFSPRDSAHSLGRGPAVLSQITTLGLALKGWTYVYELVKLRCMRLGPEPTGSLRCYCCGDLH